MILDSADVTVVSVIVMFDDVKPPSSARSANAITMIMKRFKLGLPMAAQLAASSNWNKIASASPRGCNPWA